VIEAQRALERILTDHARKPPRVQARLSAEHLHSLGLLAAPEEHVEPSGPPPTLCIVCQALPHITEGQLHALIRAQEATIDRLTNALLRASTK
jgi:hypothetical protein